MAQAGTVTYHADRNRWRARVRRDKKEYMMYAKTREAAEMLLTQLLDEHPPIARAKKEPVKRPPRTLLTPEEKKTRAKVAANTWYAKNKELIAVKRAADPEKYRKIARDSYQKNRDYVLLAVQVYSAENPHKVAARRRDREIREMYAAVSWGKEDTVAKMAQIREEYPDGSAWHIDHMVPLRGKVGNLHVVCGLHVWYNLQVLPVKDNLSKSCHTWDNMPEYTKEDLDEIAICNNQH